MSKNKKNKVKNIENILFENELAFKQIIELIPGHVYWKNRKGQFLGCNALQAQSIGLSKEKILGKTAKETMPLELAKIVMRVDERVMKNKETISVKEPGELPDGSTGLFLSKKTPLLDRNDKSIGILGVSFNLSEIKE